MLAPLLLAKQRGYRRVIHSGLWLKQGQLLADQIFQPGQRSVARQHIINKAPCLVCEHNAFLFTENPCQRNTNQPDVGTCINRERASGQMFCNIQNQVDFTIFIIGITLYYVHRFVDFMGFHNELTTGRCHLNCISHKRSSFCAPEILLVILHLYYYITGYFHCLLDF